MTSQTLQSHHFQQSVWFQIQVLFRQCNLHYEPAATLRLKSKCSALILKQPMIGPDTDKGA